MKGSCFYFYFAVASIYIDIYIEATYIYIFMEAIYIYIYKVVIYIRASIRLRETSFGLF